jgi:hypothetical protein
MPMAILGTVRAMALVLMMSASIAEQSAAQQPTQENVSKEVTNPIAFLMKFTLENDYSPSLWGSRGEQNEVQGEVVIPFEAFRNQNLFRIKVVFETSSPGGTHGLSESEVVDLVLFPGRWGTFGAGVTAHMTAQTPDQLGTAAPGPSVGAVVEHGKWKYGFLNQNFLSNSLAQTDLQPILAYDFNRKWSAESGDAQYTYDWKEGRVILLPISGQLNRVLSRGKDHLELFFRAQYNLKNDSGSNKWTMVAGLSLIPK